MMPPTSIDGTDITGATIDGQDVQEITVDGQTVFSAFTPPVAYSNLVAWYPAINGGADATAGDPNSGDSTDYSGTLGSGASVLSNGGVTDINTGANSNGFDFDGSNGAEVITNTAGVNLFGSNDEGCVTFWIKDSGGGNPVPFGNHDANNKFTFESQASEWFVEGPGGQTVLSGRSLSTNWEFVALNHWMVVEYFLAEESETGVTLQDAGMPRGNFFNGNNIYFGDIGPSADLPLDGQMDDIRIYNRKLSGLELDTIFANTKP